MIRLSRAASCLAPFRSLLYACLAIAAFSSITACSGGQSSPNPIANSSTHVSPSLDARAKGNVHRHSALALPAGCSGPAPFIICNVAVGTSLVIPASMTIDSGWDKCGPTATLSTSNSGNANVRVSIAPATLAISCGQVISPNVTFAVSSTAVPGQDGVQENAYANYTVCGYGSCPGDYSKSDQFTISVVADPCYYIPNFGQYNSLLDNNPYLQALATYLKNKKILLPALVGSVPLGDAEINPPGTVANPALHWDSGKLPVGFSQNSQALYHELLHEYYEYPPSGSSTPPFPNTNQGGPISATAQLPDQNGKTQTLTYNFLTGERGEFEHLLIHNALIAAFGKDLPYGLFESLPNMAYPNFGGPGPFDFGPYSESHTTTTATSFSYQPVPPPYPYTTPCQ